MQCFRCFRCCGLLTIHLALGHEQGLRGGGGVLQTGRRPNPEVLTRQRAAQTSITSIRPSVERDAFFLTVLGPRQLLRSFTTLLFEAYGFLQEGSPHQTFGIWDEPLCSRQEPGGAHLIPLFPAFFCVGCFGMRQTLDTWAYLAAIRDPPRVCLRFGFHVCKTTWNRESRILRQAMSGSKYGNLKIGGSVWSPRQPQTGSQRQRQPLLGYPIPWLRQVPSGWR